MVIKLIKTKIKEIREKNDYSQRQLAQKLNTSKSNYNRWETQDKIIPLTRLRNFCNYFNVSMDYLFSFTITNEYHYIPELNKKIIGQKIRNLRLDHHDTQENLAKMLNTTHSTISAYENGKTLILTAFLYQICEHYQVSMDKICQNEKNL